MEKTEVILVDEQDNPLGRAEKIEAHQKALLHRAFSVFIFNSRGEMLLQQRIPDKYHSGGLWTNACCSHPAPGEDTSVAAHKRLKEEMGFDTNLEKIFEFRYQATLDNGMAENEFDHVFAGIYEGRLKCNGMEAMDYCYKTPSRIREELQANPGIFTAWFRLLFPMVSDWWDRRNGR